MLTELGKLQNRKIQIDTGAAIITASIEGERYTHDCYTRGMLRGDLVFIYHEGGCVLEIKEKYTGVLWSREAVIDNMMEAVYRDSRGTCYCSAIGNPPCPTCEGWLDEDTQNEIISLVKVK